MATIIDTLTLELNLDASKFATATKETSERVRVQKEDFERHSQGFQSAITNLVTSLGKVVSGFLAIETVISAIEWTKGASEAATHFGVLAESIGLSVKRLSEWDQALQRVGGQPGEAGHALAFQQAELQKTKGPSGQQPSFYQSGWWQRLGLPATSTYFNAETKLFDVDRLNLDIQKSMERQGFSAAQRTQVLKDFGWSGNAAQRLFGSDIEKQLKYQSPTAMTEAQEKALEHIFGLWKDIGNSMDNLKRDIAVFLEQPISDVLDKIRKFFDWLDKKLLGPSETTPHTGFAPIWDPFGMRPAGPPKEPTYSTPQTQTNPYGGHQPADLFGLRSSPDSVVRTPPPPPVPPPTETLPGGIGEGGGAVMVGPHTGVRRPPAATPAPAPAPDAPATSVPAAPATSVPAVPAMPATPAVPSVAPIVPPTPTSPDASSTTAPSSGGFLNRWFGWGSSGSTPPVQPDIPKPQSMMDPSILGMPQQAMAGSFDTLGNKSSIDNSNSNVTIGGINFNSRASDASLGHAPNNVSDELSVGEYAVHANYGIA